MSHPYVTQLRFARTELLRCLDGVSDADARRRFEPMNCISWIVGHLASQEHFLWVMAAQQTNVAPDLYQLVGFGRPATTPPLDEMWRQWRAITAAADPFLDTISAAMLETTLTWDGKPLAEPVGKLLLRNIYHYWFHIGEAHAIRQMLGHPNLPQFVGDMAAVHYQ